MEALHHSDLYILISYGFGSLGVIAGIVRFQCRERHHILLGNVVAAFGVGAHLFMEGAFYGGAVAFVAMAGSSIAVFGAHLHLGFRIASAILATLIVMMIKGVPSSFISFLPLFAFSIARIAETSLSDMKVRLGILPSSALWLIYNTSVMAPMAIITELTNIISNFIGIRRRLKNRVPIAMP